MLKKSISDRERLIIENFHNVLNKLEGKETLSEEELEEGFKDSIMAVAMTAASLFGANKAHSQAPVAQATSQSASQNTSLNVPIGTLFGSGRYLIGDDKQEAIKAKLVEIGKFVEKHPDANFEITINSSESQVPNKNADSAAIGNDGGKPVYAPMEKGALANKRSQTANELISTFMNQLRSQGVLKGKVNYNAPKTVIGTTSYQQGEDPRQDKFTQEQFTNIIIKAVAASSNDNSAIDFSRYSKSDEMMLDVKEHGIALIWYPTTKTNKVTDNGNKDTRYEDVIVSFLGNESVKTGMASADGQYKYGQTQKASGPSFKVPWSWFNQHVRAHQLTPHNVKDIVNQNFGQTSKN